LKAWLAATNFFWSIPVIIGVKPKISIPLPIWIGDDDVVIAILPIAKLARTLEL
jgi:hypothetical protein